MSINTANLPSPNCTILCDVENGDRLIPLSELSDQPFVLKRGGRKPHKSVWFRWASRGLRGVKLEVLRAGGCLATTRSAVLRFYANLSSVDGLTTPALTSGTGLRRRRRIDRELDEAGIR